MWKSSKDFWSSGIMSWWISVPQPRIDGLSLALDEMSIFKNKIIDGCISLSRKD